MNTVCTQACRSRDENCEMKIRKIARGQSSFGQTEELTRGANSLMIPEGAKGKRDRDPILDLYRCDTPVGSATRKSGQLVSIARI